MFHLCYKMCKIIKNINFLTFLLQQALWTSQQLPFVDLLLQRSLADWLSAAVSWGNGSQLSCIQLSRQCCRIGSVNQGQPNVCWLTPYRAIWPMLTPTLLLYTPCLLDGTAATDCWSVVTAPNISPACCVVVIVYDNALCSCHSAGTLQPSPASPGRFVHVAAPLL